MPDASDDHIACATYTHARRHPMVLGQIAGWTPPFQLSVTQVAVLVLGYWLETQTWRWWGHLLPGNLAIIVALGLPWAVAWTVRRARVEGRSLPRTVVGWLMLLSAPKPGRVGGRTYRSRSAGAPGRAFVYVAPGEGTR